MNRLALVAFGLMLLACPLSAWAEPGVVFVTASSVNVRAGAEADAAKVSKAKRGERLEIIERSPPWLHVRTADGRMGWVHGDYVAESAPASAAVSKALTDKAIRKRLIAESIAAYNGSCPCPYHTDRGGRRCGRRSAHSRKGGYAPLCYDRDVSKAMVDAYRASHAAE